jgi:hypothetical protein
VGYLIAGHFVKQHPDPITLRTALPAAVGFTVYKHETYSIFAIDTYRASKPSRRPFSVSTPATDISLEVPDKLTAIYEELRTENAANGFKRSYINLARLLSRALDDEVLSIFADDDGNDFECLSRSGAVVSGKARCERYIVSFGPTHASRTLVTSELHLHQLAASAVTSVLGVPASDLGFGSFDPPENLGFEVAR